jgi:hypothetical protein
MKKWVPVVIGIVIFVIIVGLGLVGGAVYMFTRQVSIETMPSSSGVEEFEKLRAQHGGQQPFIELPSEDSDAEPVVHKELATGQAGRVTTVHVRVWIPDERKLVRVDLPMWTLRLMGSRPIRFETGHGSIGRMSLKVTAEDIDRRGPGLIMDHAAPRGERVLIWSE